MRVKAVQIAKELGISKATVSLALNNKPGVSERTREEVQACLKRLEQEAEQVGVETADRGTVKVIVASKGLKVGFASEIDLWTDVLAVFEKEAKKRRYRLGVIYIDVRAESIDDVVEECNSSDTAGVILQATELDDSDISKFEKIETPLVIYDNESTDSHHNCVVADNLLGVERAVKYLFQRGYHDIVYLENENMIYNFSQRRKGFCEALLNYNRNPYEKGRMVPVGTTIEHVYRKMRGYLEENALPEAFIAENYQVTIGVMRALKERQIKVPEQLALIGVDTLPAYMTGDCLVTAVRIPHTERAVLTMMLLEKEIEEQSRTKSRIMTDCPLIDGESVQKYNREV